MFEALGSIVSKWVVKSFRARNGEADRINFRQNILTLERLMQAKVNNGSLVEGNYPVTHHFSPIDKKYGCCVYARQIFLPKGHLIVGKIHKHAHLNFVLKGKISVATEFEKQVFEAPCIFLSQAGVKRAGYVEEDTIWVTVHLTEHYGQERLEAIENEVIAKNYSELGMSQWGVLR